MTPKLSQKVNCIQSIQQDAYWAMVFFLSWSISPSQNLAFQICTICEQSADIVSFFCQSFKMELFFVAHFIYGGEKLYCILNFTIQFRLVPDVIFCFFLSKKYQTFREFLLQLSKQLRFVRGIRSKEEHGPKSQ